MRLLEHWSGTLHFVRSHFKYNHLSRLSGFPPFYDEDNDNLRLFEKIKKGKYDFPSPSWDVISQEAKDIIKNLLVLEPEGRMNCEQLLKHPWILGETSTDKQLKRQQ